jgi:acetyl esterase/lipase
MRKLNRREFATVAAAAGMTLAVRTPTLQAIPQANSPSALGPYALVDPELIPAIKGWPQLVLTNETLAAVRKSEQAWQLLPPPAPQLVDRHITGPKGNPDLRVVVIDPAPAAKNRPAFLHIHGGGYVAGKAAMFSSLLQRAAQACGCLIISVDYRLAPETQFPGSLEDNYAALAWLYSNGDLLGVDRKRIAIGGESAGGGHSAALAIAARDRMEIPIAFQLLIYPMLDDRTASSRPVPSHIGNLVWTRECNVFGWTSILGKPAGSANVPSGSVPARVENLAGLPPTFIAVGSIDLFVDEDVEYARRLLNAGVPTELQVFPGGYHGFDLLVPNASISTRFTAAWIDALKRAFRAV